MKTALLFSISMLTVNNAIAKCDCSSTPEFQKRNCNKVGEGEDPETKDKCHTFGGKWVLPPKEEPTQCTKFSAVEGEAASANAGFSCCNNMKIGQEGGKVPKCGYFESGQCKLVTHRMVAKHLVRKRKDVIYAVVKVLVKIKAYV